MLYTILAYHPAGVVDAWSAEHRAAVVEKLGEVHDRLTREGKLGPAAGLDFTSSARTLRGEGDGVAMDGPFAETKEHLLGFYIVNCADAEEAVEIARALRRANPTAVYEIRPVGRYLAGAPQTAG